MSEPLELFEPGVEMEGEYRAFLSEFKPLGQDDQLHWSSGCEPNWDCFECLIRKLRDNACGIDLGDGQVLHSTYWLMRDERIIGTCNLRHRITKEMEGYFGHIGYCVRPSERRRGYGTLMLAMCLQKASQMSIEQAILICMHHNLGSIGVIENNGGHLISEIHLPNDEFKTRRYHVPTASN